MPLPPVAIILTVPVPPLHEIGVVTTAEVMTMGSGWVIVRVPVTGAQFMASVTLQLYVPAATLLMVPPA